MMQDLIDQDGNAGTRRDSWAANQMRRCSGLAWTCQARAGSVIAPAWNVLRASPYSSHWLAEMARTGCSNSMNRILSDSASVTLIYWNCEVLVRAAASLWNSYSFRSKRFWRAVCCCKCGFTSALSGYLNGLPKSRCTAQSRRIR
jgi:hypothetical protein